MEKKLISFENWTRMCEEYKFGHPWLGVDPWLGVGFTAKCPVCGEWLEHSPDRETLECLNGHYYHT